MPCQLSEEINYVNDDVFSYMCNLAMEKCSKKMEKKKASCGGEAMRKRLLIKNFVAQMLAQEKQTREQHSLSTENVGGGSTLKSISAAGEESNTGRMEIDEKKYVETLDEEEEESELNTSVDEEDDIEDEEEEEIKDGNEEDQEVEAAVASILTGKRSGCIADNNKNDNREMTLNFGPSHDFQPPSQLIRSQHYNGLMDEDDWDDENEKPFQNSITELDNANKMAETADNYAHIEYGNRKRTWSLVLEDQMMDVQQEMAAPSHLPQSSTETFTMLSPLCCGLLQLQPFGGQTTEMQIGLTTGGGGTVPYSQPLMKRVKL